MMDSLLYLVARALVAFLQALPLRTVARIGRAGGWLAFWLDRRHRHVALRNLTLCFSQEKSPVEIRKLARENFRRIGETYACAVKTAAMTPEQLRPHFKIVGADKIPSGLPDARPRSCIAAIGHFGNFELYARVGQFVPALQCATTYRGLKPPSLDRVLRSLRERSGCLYFERRTGGAALRAAMNGGGLLLGLLADQHGGDRGLRLPFLGRDCSTVPAPAVFALRYRCPLHAAICYRTGPGSWKIEIGNEIPTQENGRPRSVEAITRDINRAFEEAIRRDPANWFWVHNRWKPFKVRGPASDLQDPVTAQTKGRD